MEDTVERVEGLREYTDMIIRMCDERGRGDLSDHIQSIRMHMDALVSEIHEVMGKLGPFPDDLNTPPPSC